MDYEDLKLNKVYILTTVNARVTLSEIDQHTCIYSYVDRDIHIPYQCCPWNLEEEK